MAKFIVEGGIPLKGEINVSGSKNAILPIMAAALLADTPSIINNVPDIGDVHTMAEIIASTGAEIEQIDIHSWRIGGKGLHTSHIKPDLARKLRASILMVSPLLARRHEAIFPHPGGCVIGQRPLDTHFEALKALGTRITTDESNYIAKIAHSQGASMFIDEVSVTATENALMLAVLSPGETIIKPAACEPHVVDLANFLKQMGARIEGEGTHTIRIWGVDKLSGVENYRIIPDNLDAGTFAIAAVATKGDITINQIKPDDLDPIIHKLTQMGCEVNLNRQSVTIKHAEDLKATRIQIDTWPRLPTDLQAPFGVLATQAHGTSLIHDWLYERRLMYTEDLIRMGANITQCDPHRALVTGPTKLYGTKISSLDIRAGVAMVIATLVAKGKSEIDHIELIDRGYEDLDGRLRSLGAQIRRVNSESENKG